LFGSVPTIPENPVIPDNVVDPVNEVIDNINGEGGNNGDNQEEDNDNCFETIFTITDPCDPQSADESASLKLTAPDVPNIEYTIGFGQETFDIPAFTVEPDFCFIRYTYVVKSIAETSYTGDPSVALTANGE
jgi:hypothetical protein